VIYFRAVVAIVIAGAFVRASNSQTIHVLDPGDTAQYKVAVDTDEPNYSIVFGAPIQAGRTISVRAFPGSKRDWLKLADGVKKDDCLQIRFFKLFQAGAGQIARELNLQKLILFARGSSSDGEDYVLVFEDGENAATANLLKLSSDGVKRYFSRGIQVHVEASDSLKRLHRENSRPGFLIPVVAATQPPPAPVAPIIVPAPCFAVLSPLPPSKRLEQAVESKAPVVLASIATMEARQCGS
jgi:hypothetical protein